jgi:UDP-N-acetylglucosamine 2-epimerase (non-hydrolysing)
MTHTVACVIGTRPEAIKMAPVVLALKAAPWARCVVVATAQHRDLLDQMLKRLRVAVDHDLNLMMDGQTSTGLLARMIPALDEIFAREQPNMVLAQGDTTTVFGAALCAFLHRISFGHVEAGLRTNDLEQPFPEEGYRQMVSRVARWHFAPTPGAARALLAEGIAEDRIHVTGNTCIDALLQAIGEMKAAPRAFGRSILLTVHRRESFGAPLRDIFTAVLKIVERFPDVSVTYPVHPNPNVRQPANEILSGHPRIRLCDPLDYFEFVDLMRCSTLILTDSGGVQEEAPALGKPVLVLRDATERPEALACGSSRLVGTNTEHIVEEVSTLLADPDLLAGMSQVRYPYGDGRAAQRIVDMLHV